MQMPLHSKGYYYSSTFVYVILILQFTSPRLRLSDLIKKSLYFASMTQLDFDFN